MLQICGHAYRVMSIARRSALLGALLLMGGTGLADLMDALEPEPSTTKQEIEPSRVQSEPAEPAKSEVAKPDSPKSSMEENPARPTPVSNDRTDRAPQRQAGVSQPKKATPVHFEGDGFSGFRKKGFLELTKDVHIAQGDMSLDADRAKVYFDVETDEVKNVVASGRVRLKKKDSATGQNVDATSDVAEFDAANQIITLKGDAKLKRGEDVIRGAVIKYNLESGWVRADKVRGVVRSKEPVEPAPEDS